ncbi:hypothetical protein [Sphingobacterium yanglingense]|uniref:Uncharacterized protein n=1 Tax=Sphingobacterium yanglingense TaxID=1437280 RepID=A0A4R6WGH8_9SPHI|nr:hypothetical protein [Sphingobacterium yanglingense]TDQ77462.1 hypothetical protein CLV99_2869 [Sphingobacterium yanglingense]
MSTIFQPKSFFFTDPNSITQDALRSFGPQSANVFNITASFQSSGAKAYAICKGTVLIQPQTGNSNLVNLILRPFSQPINGLPIRYFVYRGLRVQDFFNGNLVKDAGTNESDYINKAQQAFENYYTSIEQPKPLFEAKYIGYDPANQSAELDIDSLFFKQAQYQSGEEELQQAFELPMVQAGHSLGYFAQGECGMDVILSYGDYKLENPIDEFAFNLEYARAPLATIDITNVSDEYKSKRIKEQVQQFIDVAAFYGFHAGNGTVSVYEGSAVAKKKEAAIYDAVVSKFYSKHRLYLYIQSDRGRSYDFYGNYYLSDASDNNIRIGDSSENKTAYKFGSQGWPVQIIESNQSHNTTVNEIYINLVTDSNPNAMLYVQVGSLTNAVKNNFMDAAALSTPENPDHLWINDYTPDLILANPAVGAPMNKEFISNFNSIIYQGKTLEYGVKTITEDDAELTQIYNSDFFDDIFDLLTAKPLLKQSMSNDYMVLSSPHIKQIGFLEDTTQKVITAVQTLIVRDSIPNINNPETKVERVSYITEQSDILNYLMDIQSQPYTVDTINFSALSNSTTISSLYQLPDPYFYTITEIVDGTHTIKGISLHAKDNSKPLKIIVGITLEENSRIQDIISINSLSNPRLFLTEYNQEINTFTDEKGIRYKKYKLSVSGENEENIPELHLPQAEIILYSLDDNYHFSSDYSLQMTEQPIYLIREINLSK